MKIVNTDSSYPLRPFTGDSPQMKTILANTRVVCGHGLAWMYQNGETLDHRIWVRTVMYGRNYWGVSDSYYAVYLDGKLILKTMSYLRVLYILLWYSQGKLWQKATGREVASLEPCEACKDRIEWETRIERNRVRKHA
jgi:hypothetical protein